LDDGVVGGPRCGVAMALLPSMQYCSLYRHVGVGDTKVQMSGRPVSAKISFDPGHCETRGATNMTANKKILIFYGSYREPRFGIRLVKYLIARLAAYGLKVEFIDAREIGLPMLSRMYKEYPSGTAPAAMETLAGKIRSADGFVFVCGEYNWGLQPGLKNLTDHFFEEWFWRPAAIASYSLQRSGGARAGYCWHGTLSEMGMIVVSSSITIGPVTEALDEAGAPIGESGKYLEKAFPRFADDLVWWIEAATAQRLRVAPPY